MRTHLVNEFVALIKKTSNVVVRVIIDQKLFVPEMPFVKARDDWAGVQDVCYATFQQRLHVSCGTDGACNGQ